jgi:hypothetical protein
VIELAFIETSLIIKSLFYFLLAFFLALVEIELEGKFGWAEKAQTWYRTTGIWKLLQGGKPMTGYHLFMNIFLFLIFHFAFFIGLPWTLSKELILLALFCVFVPLWDFLWFVLNPNYGIKNYKESKIWWFSTSKWMFGMFPAEYLIRFIVSAAIAYAAGYSASQPSIFYDHLITLVLFLVFTLITIVFIAKPYHRWHRFMRRRDDRARAGIHH